jgi:microcystin-dependent protein
MAYNEKLPADNTASADIRENFRALKQDKIVAATSAVKLETAHTINGVAFDGTADIIITQVNGKNIATTDQIPAASVPVPIGGIIMWSGSDIPINWALCNGSSGTPDLRGKFILGTSGEYPVGSVGGEKTHKLTVAEMPSHNHVTKLGNGSANQSAGSNAPWMQDYGTTDNTGGDQPHNNMPPYYALAYIMRIL